MTDDELLKELKEQYIRARAFMLGAQRAYLEALRSQWVDKISMAIYGYQYGPLRNTECLIKYSDGEKRIKIIDLIVHDYNDKISIHAHSLNKNGKWSKDTYLFDVADVIDIIGPVPKSSKQ